MIFSIVIRRVATRREKSGKDLVLSTHRIGGNLVFREGREMARVESSVALHHLRTLFRDGTHAGLTDRQLLERFLARDDETAEPAFTTLVGRHGPMVLGVCERILHDPHDAADAFQATFLVLLRKASTLQVEGSLGRWLHGVSRRIALQARKAAARRASREMVNPALLTAPSHDPDRYELRVIVDEEIARLPQRYREAIVLCELEGLTHDAAARQLGCPCGTIESRLSRGRQRLRTRLTRRGLDPWTSVIPAAFGPTPVPPKLTGSVVRAAVKTLAGAPLADVAPTSIRALAIGCLRAMTITQIQVVALALTLIVVGAAGAMVGNKARAAEPRGRNPQMPQSQAERPGAANEIDLRGRTAYDPNALVKIRPRFDTLVEKVNVELGQKVKKGDPLVVISSTELAAAKNDFQTRYVQWQHDLEICWIRERAIKSSAVSNQQVVDARNDENKSRLAFTTARQKLIVFGVPEEQIDSLKDKRPSPPDEKQDAKLSDKARLTRRSPVDGVVIKRDVVPGNLYDNKDVLLVIANVEHLLVWANISHADRAHVAEGQGCAVVFPYVSSTIRGEIDTIIERKTPGEPSTFLIRITIPNPDSRFKADALVRVRIPRVAR
jgi:RNA polymerase sigma factor (sigma-70 family)